jgi:hypothetical protein
MRKEIFGWKLIRSANETRRSRKGFCFGYLKGLKIIFCREGTIKNK